VDGLLLGLVSPGIGTGLEWESGNLAAGRVACLRRGLDEVDAEGKVSTFWRKDKGDGTLALTTVAATENDGFSADTIAATEWGAALLFRFKMVAIWLVEIAIHFVEPLDGRVQLCDRCVRLGVMSGDGLWLILLLLLPLLVLALLLEVQFAHLQLVQLGFMILLLRLFAFTFS